MTENEFASYLNALDDPEVAILKPKPSLRQKIIPKGCPVKFLPDVDVIHLTYDEVKPQSILLAARSELSAVFKDQSKKPHRTKKEITLKVHTAIEYFLELKSKSSDFKDQPRLDVTKENLIFELQSLLNFSQFDHVIVQEAIKKIENTNWFDARELAFLLTII